jgi:GlpG protein
MFLAIEVTSSLDLTQFRRLLWQRKVSNHVVEQDEQQLVLVAEQLQVEQARELFRQWQQGAVQPLEDDSSALTGYVNTKVLKNAFVLNLRYFPLTLLLIAVCVVLWFVAPLDTPTALTYALLYPDFSYGTGLIVLSNVLASFGIKQAVTMLTPILLHGGLLHLVFNMTWLLELGRRIERVQSAFSFALAIIVLALFSNTIQYFYGGGNNFGGMSGVIYGLFAYIWTWQLFDPRKGLALPGSLILFMLASLVIFTLLGLDMIANAAHIGGFLTGMAYGAVVSLASRIRRNAQDKVAP